jgi:hypothetical protein
MPDNMDYAAEIYEEIGERQKLRTADFTKCDEWT